MPPTPTPPVPDPQRPDPRAFLEQQAAILLEAPDNDTMVRRLLAAALQRISVLEQQLAATPAGRLRPQASLRPAILTQLREQPDGLTRAQLEAALAQPGLGDTLRRMVRDAVLVRTGDRYRLAPAAPEGPAPAAATPPAPPVSAPTPAPRKRGGRPRTRGQA
jgi:hypothetical protein